MEALDHVLRQGYHLALLRYAVEDDEHYTHYCARRGLKMEPIMDFEYSLLTNRDGPLARHEVKDLAELNHYMEIMHDDFQLPGEDGGDGGGGCGEHGLYPFLPCWAALGQHGKVKGGPWPARRRAAVAHSPRTWGYASGRTPGSTWPPPVDP